MQSVYKYVVEPLGDRYNNSKKIGDKELILNTEVFNHQYICLLYTSDAADE